jgi:Domain of unknown function DUF29
MSTYDEDFYGWTREQADYLRHDKWEKVDVLHVAEEIESLGIHDEHAITRQLQRLLLHLLKWHYQPTHPVMRSMTEPTVATVCATIPRSA